jgi:hypothetical protein
MFTKRVTDDENFMNLSSSAQALYLHLSMSADDDGFSNQISVSMFKAHASVQDLQALLEKRYIYQFENGVIVIKHWKMANALRKDRYTPTAFQDELRQLRIKENGSYTMDDGCQLVDERLPNGCQVGDRWLPDGCQVVAERLPQYSIDKNSIDKISIGEDKEGKNRKRFVPPTIEEVQEYCRESNNNVDVDKWFAHYQSNGWMVGKNKMKDWKASVRYWENSESTSYQKPSEKPAQKNPFLTRDKGSFLKDLENMAIFSNGVNV